MTFMSADLSSFYLDIAKDTLYCEAKDSVRRNQVQSVMYLIAEDLLRILNPILPFTMDEFNLNLPGERKSNPQFLDYPKASEVDELLLKEYEDFKSLRDDVLKALENARNNKVIGSAQEAHVFISLIDGNNPLKTILNSFDKELLAKMFVVSEVSLKENNGEEYKNLKVEVIHHTGHFCERCWNYDDNAIIQEDGTYLCPRCNRVIKNG